MKLLLTVPVALVFYLTTAFITSDNIIDDVPLAFVNETQKVYVCGGKYSEKFHSHSKCKGLNNCKGGICEYASQQAAVNKGYLHCKICWH